ncbi:MAG: Fe-S cluster assembly protein IscX [Phycisphaeraceae bacterium]|nr:Fe-S cluster assembly protein IscX [Phycisphaeraceae bacterium]
MSDQFHWLDVDRIAEELAGRFPDMDPGTVGFVHLRDMVRTLPGFFEDPAHPVNERILEAIQAGWTEEYHDMRGDDDED